MRLVAAIALLAGCSLGSTSVWHVPIGWRGSIPGCEEPAPASPDVIGIDSGFLVARRSGESDVRCKARTIRLEVRPVGRLAIEGPARVKLGDRPGYWLRVYDSRGEELSLPDVDFIVDWSTSDGSEIHRAYCHEPIFSCPDSDFARLRPARAGPMTIEATFAGGEARLDILVE